MALTRLFLGGHTDPPTEKALRYYLLIFPPTIDPQRKPVERETLETQRQTALLLKGTPHAGNTQQTINQARASYL